jgi:hypothetical protein
MAALWTRVQSARDLAPELGDERAFASRLGRPGGARIEDFYLALRDGQLTGFSAVWNPSGARQVRILSVSGATRITRALYNLAARVTGRPRMPADGELLRSSYLSFLCAREPADLEAILGQARSDLRESGQLLLAVALDQRDPLMAAAQRGFALRVDYDVIACTWDGQPIPPCEQPVYLDLALA